MPVCRGLTAPIRDPRTANAGEEEASETIRAGYCDCRILRSEFREGGFWYCGDCRRQRSPSPPTPTAPTGFDREVAWHREQREARGEPAERCRKFLGDNDATCPQLWCIREKGHPGLCDNTSDKPDPSPSPAPTALTKEREALTWLAERIETAANIRPRGADPEGGHVYLTVREGRSILAALDASRTALAEAVGAREDIVGGLRRLAAEKRRHAAGLKSEVDRGITLRQSAESKLARAQVLESCADGCDELANAQPVIDLIPFLDARLTARLAEAEERALDLSQKLTNERALAADACAEVDRLGKLPHLVAAVAARDAALADAARLRDAAGTYLAVGAERPERRPAHEPEWEAQAAATVAIREWGTRLDAAHAALSAALSASPSTAWLEAKVREARKEGAAAMQRHCSDVCRGDLAAIDRADPALVAAIEAGATGEP